MCQLRELDRSRWVTSTAIEEWKANHEMIRIVWSFEDLIANICDTCRKTVEMFSYYSVHHSLPNRAVPLSYIVDILQKVDGMSRDVEALGAKAEDAYREIDHLEELRGYRAQISALVGQYVGGPEPLDISLLESDPPREWLDDRSWAAPAGD